MKRKNNGKNKFNNFKRSIRDFMKDEQGFVSKDNILKIGLGTISALGMIGSLSNTFAGHSSGHSAHASHGSSGATTNQNVLTSDWVPGTACYRIAATHLSHVSHASHPSHANTHNSHGSY